MPNRQPSANTMIAEYPDANVLVKTIEMPKSYVDKMHLHTWHQVIFPIKGLLQTQSENCQYLVPHTSALFIPANLPHESIALSNTTFLGVYINPALSAEYEDRIRTISLTPFVSELLKQIRKECLSHNRQAHLAKLLAVLHDQITESEIFSFQLLLPKDKRLTQIFEHLTKSPSTDWSLKTWGEKVGASERTLSRLFAKEFRTSFSLWRQHLRLILSLTLLDEKMPIQLIADKVGYKNDSSYIKAFKAYFEQTPQQFKLSREQP